MNKYVMIIEAMEIYEEAIKQGYKANFLSKGSEYDRESLNILDAEKCAAYDIVILESSQKTAEEFRKMMERFKQKETIICWFRWKGWWCDKGGKYQVTGINESFCDGQIIPASYPNFEGFEAACNKLKSLSEGTMGVKTK